MLYNDGGYDVVDLDILEVGFVLVFVDVSLIEIGYLGFFLFIIIIIMLVFVLIRICVCLLNKFC